MQHRLWMCLTLSALACGAPAGTRGAEGPATAGVAVAVVRQVTAVAETPPVATPRDAADDPAIWINLQDPSNSLVIGTDKQRGLQVYGLDGRLLQTLPDGRLNNVDLRDGFVINGRAVALVAASNRSDKSIAFYQLDPATLRLTRIGPSVATGFADPYGICMYASRDGGHFVFVNDSGTGRFRQWRIRAHGGEIIAEKVRDFAVGSRAEGCVADDESGALYVAEEGGGLWKYRADSRGGDTRRRIDRVGGASGLIEDLEGLAIWQGRDGRGYIVLSNQGASNFAVYRREGDNAFVGLFQIVDDAQRGIDGTSETDGLDVTSRPLGPSYPDGLLVVQDGSNAPAGQHQNFKFVSWRAVARSLGISEGD